LRGADVTVVYPTVSVGVSTPVSVAGPAAAGAHEHLATNGETVVVATASQPVMTVAPTEKATFPGTLAVATMIAGLRPKTVLPPDSVRVGVAAAANADELPTIADPARARATIRALDFLLFIPIAPFV